MKIPRYYYRLLLAFCSLWPLASFAAPQEPVHARLIVERAPQSSAKIIGIGVLFQIEPGWHLYWRNPGDSGLAPSIEWKLPPSVKIKELQWPAPAAFDFEGSIIYGYEHELLLFADANVAKAAPVSAQVRWVACKDICLSGSASLQLKQWHADHRFGPWRSRIPTATASLGQPELAEYKSCFLLRWNPKNQDITSPYFFPEVPESLDYAKPPRVRQTAGEFELLLQKGAAWTPHDKLAGVLTFREGESPRQLALNLAIKSHTADNAACEPKN